MPLCMPKFKRAPIGLNVPLLNNVQGEGGGPTDVQTSNTWYFICNLMLLEV